MNTLADIDLSALTPAQYGIVILAVTIIAAASAWFLTRSMVRVGELPDAQPLVIALAVLTLVALLGALVTGNENAYTLTATGMGAIAGAVTATWGGGRSRQQQDQQPPEPDAPEDQS